MKLFYIKYIFFCNNLRENKVFCRKNKSQELRNLIEKRVKELAIKKARINSSESLNRRKLCPIEVSYSERNWYKITSKENIGFLREYILIKRKPFKKNSIEN